MSIKNSVQVQITTCFPTKETNANGFRFSQEAIEKLKKSIYPIPIISYEGQKDKYIGVASGKPIKMECDNKGFCYITYEGNLLLENIEYKINNYIEDNGIKLVTDFDIVGIGVK